MATQKHSEYITKIVFNALKHEHVNPDGLTLDDVVREIPKHTGRYFLASDVLISLNQLVATGLAVGIPHGTKTRYRVSGPSAHATEVSEETFFTPI